LVIRKEEKKKAKSKKERGKAGVHDKILFSDFKPEGLV